MHHQAISSLILTAALLTGCHASAGGRLTPLYSWAATRVVFPESGSSVALAVGTSTVEVRRLDTGQILSRSFHKAQPVDRGQISPSGAHAVLGGQLRETATWHPFVFPGSAGARSISATLAPAGDLVVGRSGNGVQLYQWPQGAPLGGSIQVKTELFQLFNGFASKELPLTISLDGRYVRSGGTLIERVGQEVRSVSMAPLPAGGSRRGWVRGHPEWEIFSADFNATLVNRVTGEAFTVPGAPTHQAWYNHAADRRYIFFSGSKYVLWSIEGKKVVWAVNLPEKVKREVPSDPNGSFGPRDMAIGEKGAYVLCQNGALLRFQFNGQVELLDTFGPMIEETGLKIFNWGNEGTSFRGRGSSLSADGRYLAVEVGFDSDEFEIFRLE